MKFNCINGLSLSYKNALRDHFTVVHEHILITDFNYHIVSRYSLYKLCRANEQFFCNQCMQYMLLSIPKSHLYFMP
jgi:hypothetical protein